MFNLSDKTELRNYSGKSSALQQAVSDRNLHRDSKFDYFGRRVRRGTVEVFLRGEWKQIRFDVERGWAKSVEVL